MAKRKSLADSTCPVARALDVIGDRWSLLIVRDAFDGARRFGEFQSGLGVARNILAARLRHLVEHGILATAPASEGGAYHDYLLTPKGEALFGVVLSLRQWGEAQLYRRGEAHSRLLERASGKPLLRMQPLNREGQLLRAADTRVKKLP
jgi:DNA-binding HxlR family transcriptional regulator